MMIIRREKKSHRDKSSNRRTPKCKRNLPALSGPRLSRPNKLARVNSQSLRPAPPSLAAYGLTNSDLAKMHPDLVGDIAYLIVTDKMPLSKEMRDAAPLGAVSFHKQMGAKDALERLALTQALLAHARSAWLTKLLTDQTDPQAFGTVAEACERAAGTFARLTRAVAEYRQPKGPSTTFSIGQANLAGQQVVQNVQRLEGAQKENDEQTRINGREAAIDAEAVPVDEKRTGLTEGNHQGNKTVGKKHGANKRGR